MPDIFAPEKRHEIMQNVKTKNTAPEIKLRSLLHKNGFRFRVNRKDLPGKPDIVLQKLVDCLEKCLICRHIRRFAD